MNLTFENQKVNVRILLAFLWVSQFLIWTFGDMLSLLQELDEPADNLLLGAVAAPLAVLQVSMVLFSLVGKAKLVRWISSVAILLFVVFNIGFMAEAKYGWEYVLGAAYLGLNALMLTTVWKWGRQS